jgi:3-phenylpropionate/trans-cinnamate dioxygenase ferredoxin reductase subunit
MAENVMAKGEYSAFWFLEGRVLAGMNVNVWDVSDAVADLVRFGGQVDAARLVDPDVAWEGLVGKTTTGVR